MQSFNGKLPGYLIALLVLLLGCKPSNLPQHGNRFGDKWLAMNEKEKNIFIEGVVEGYVFASFESCHLLESEFSSTDPSLLAEVQRLNTTPSGLCIKRMGGYSRVDREKPSVAFHNYAVVMSAFYEHHQEFRDVPPIDLLIQMSDGHDSTEEELYADAVKGKMGSAY
jgi:hypothetical protein